MKKIDVRSACAWRRPTMRKGATLVELLIFVAILGMIIGAILPILFSASENRILQQTISIVEQNGTQILQNVALRVRQAERVLGPTSGVQGSVLALQTSSGAINPTIIGSNSGRVIIVEHATLETISSDQVAVEDFRVRNTSVSPVRQSVYISFRVSRTIRLQQPKTYSQRFEATMTLLPDDRPQGNSCGCAPPACQGYNIYGWEVCDNGVCGTASTPLLCP